MNAPRFSGFLLVISAITLAACANTQQQAISEPSGEWDTSAALQAAQGGTERVLLGIGFVETYHTADSVLLSRLGAQFDYRFRSIPAVAVYLPRSVVPHLRRNPRVDYVSIGRLHGGTLEEESWGHDRHEVTYAHGQGFTGDGITIAVIGTGVDCPLTAIDCVPGKSYVAGEDEHWDIGNHGSPVASIAAGNGGDYHGIAPGSEILPVKIINEQGQIPGGCVTSAMAIDYAAGGADIINLSYFTAEWNDSYYSQNCDVEGETILGVGSGETPVFVTAAAGNIADNGDSIPWPARWQWANMAVTSGLMLEDCGLNCEWVRYYPGSSYGSQLTISAAGYKVESVQAFSADISERTGTSFAAPHVAGAAALIMEAWPQLQKHPGRLREHIMHTAKMPQDPLVYDELYYGAGILDVQAAIATDPCSHMPQFCTLPMPEEG